MAEHFGALALPVGEYLALGQGTEFMGYTRISEDDVTNSLGHKFITDRCAAQGRTRTAACIGVLTVHECLLAADCAQGVVTGQACMPAADIGARAGQGHAVPAACTVSPQPAAGT